MGTAAALCAARGILPRNIQGDAVKALQQTLLDDGVFLPGVRRDMPAATKAATLHLPAEQRTILQNGIDRPRSDTEDNGITLPKGAALTFSYDGPTAVDTLRLQFDLLRILQAERQLVSAQADLDRIAERRSLAQHDGGARRNAHIQQAAAQRALSVDGRYAAALANFQFIQCHDQFPVSACG